MSSKFLPRFQVAFTNTTKFSVLAAQRMAVNKNTSSYKMIVSNERLRKREEINEYIGKQIDCMSLEEHEAIVAGLEEKLVKLIKVTECVRLEAEAKALSEALDLYNNCLENGTIIYLPIRLTDRIELARNQLAKLKGES